MESEIRWLKSEIAGDGARAGTCGAVARRGLSDVTFGRGSGGMAGGGVTLTTAGAPAVAVMETESAAVIAPVRCARVATTRTPAAAVTSVTAIQGSARRRGPGWTIDGPSPRVALGAGLVIGTVLAATAAAGAATIGSLSSTARTTARPNSATLSYRSPTSDVRARFSTSCSACGQATSGRTSTSVRGGDVSRLTSVSLEVSFGYGSSPVSMLKRTSPSE